MFLPRNVTKYPLKKMEIDYSKSELVHSESQQTKNYLSHSNNTWNFCNSFIKFLLVIVLLCCLQYEAIDHQGVGTQWWRSVEEISTKSTSVSFLIRATLFFTVITYNAVNSLFSSTSTSKPRMTLLFSVKLQPHPLVQLITKRTLQKNKKQASLKIILSEVTILTFSKAQVQLALIYSH